MSVRAWLVFSALCRGRHTPASTLVIVSGFARTEFKVEIEAISAKVDGQRMKPAECLRRLPLARLCRAECKGQYQALRGER